MSENLRKILIYFQDSFTYWKLTETAANTHWKLRQGPYPLDLKQRIVEKHFDQFDNSGIPVIAGKFHHKLHHFTTMCAYALGRWQMFYETGDESHSKILCSIADYLRDNGEQDDRLGFVLRDESEQREHGGPISAMTQGEAMSVFCRAAEYAGETNYLDLALKCAIPFEVSAEEGGVRGEISAEKIAWYEEYPQPPTKHVLNGMIYALIGLHELHTYSNDPRIGALFDHGVQNLIKGLDHFDTGFWSNYWVSDAGNIVGSMMYHNLHICQLQVLYRITSRPELKRYADLFLSYAANPANRLRAALAIFKRKAF